MKKTQKIVMITVFSVGLVLLTACGDDKLVMSTTENTRVTTEADNTSDIDYSTEEASEEEKQTTLEQIMSANSGDSLLKGSKGFGAEMTFYEDGEISGTENYYIGFDSDGNYVQLCEDSNGVYRVLDHNESCWYVSDGNAVYTLIYPEQEVFERLVDYYHNDTVYTSVGSDTGIIETITDIYRKDGKLMIKTVTSYDGVDGATYTYVLSDDLKIEEYKCIDVYGNPVVDEKTSLDAVYDEPAFAAELKNRDLGRTITIKFVDTGAEYSYYVSALYPVCFDAFEGTVYTDEACQNEWPGVTWEDEMMDENGLYPDQTVYYIKN